MQDHAWHGLVGKRFLNKSHSYHRADGAVLLVGAAVAVPRPPVLPAYAELPLLAVVYEPVVLLQSYVVLRAASPPPASPLVRSPAHCPGVQRLQLLTPAGLAAFTHNPVCGLVGAAAVAVRLHEQGSICRACAEAKWDELMHRREEIWAGLDGVLGLAPD